MFIKAKYVDLTGYLNIDSDEVIFENQVFNNITHMILNYNKLINLKIETEIFINFLNGQNIAF